jgi:hypothetical protein
MDKSKHGDINCIFAFVTASNQRKHFYLCNGKIAELRADVH